MLLLYLANLPHHLISGLFITSENKKKFQQINIKSTTNQPQNNPGIVQWLSISHRSHRPPFCAARLKGVWPWLSLSSSPASDCTLGNDTNATWALMLPSGYVKHSDIENGHRNS
jgi:hypothetical protein